MPATGRWIWEAMKNAPNPEVQKIQAQGEVQAQIEQLKAQIAAQADQGKLQVQVQSEQLKAQVARDREQAQDRASQSRPAACPSEPRPPLRAGLLRSCR